MLLRIRLACNEVASLREPPPLFRLAPRLAYLPSFFNDVYEHFKASLPPRMGQAYEIWFDCNGVALKWHYPVGVLCDLFYGYEVPTPLDLTVHFRGNSSKELLPFAGVADLQRVVMNAFRQGVYLQQNNTAPFMKLPKQQQTQLWDSICKTNVESYMAVQQQLMCPSLSKCKSLPIRLHLVDPAGPAQQHHMVLHPVPPFEEDTGSAGGIRPSTLGDYLRKVMPLLLVAEEAEVLRPDVELVCHGLRVPTSTPIYWLALNAFYLDQFVHLVARVPSDLLQSDGVAHDC